jgi:hypothetical protein
MMTVLFFLIVTALILKAILDPDPRGKIRAGEMLARVPIAFGIAEALDGVADGASDGWSHHDDSWLYDDDEDWMLRGEV